jgi:hypothetical protein
MCQSYEISWRCFWDDVTGFVISLKFKRAKLSSSHMIIINSRHSITTTTTLECKNTLVKFHQSINDGAGRSEQAHAVLFNVK